MNAIVKIKNELIDPAVFENHVVALFEQNEIENVTKQLVEYCESVVHDISTPEGREELNKFYKNINKSSRLLDGLGKDHVAKVKELPKLIDRNRKAMRDRLEQLAADVRTPLTEWEQAEKARKNSILGSINKMIIPSDETLLDTSTKIQRFLEFVQTFDVESDDLMEFKEYAVETKEDNQLKLEGLLARQLKVEQEAEAERIRQQEEAAKAQKEREERIAREAAENARIEAERKAQDEREEIERREKAAIEAKERAEREAIAAQERAKIQEKAAAITYQRRAEEERKKAEAEAAKREANKKHNAKINNEIVDAIMNLSLSSDEQEITKGQAKLIVTAIAKGQIPHTKINY